MKRVYLRRDEIRKPDVYIRNINFRYIRYGRVGSKEFESGYFETFSKKTGNPVRRLYYDVVEIENIATLFYLIYDDNMVRSKEMVRSLGGKWLELTPIARVKYTNHIVYAVKEQG